MKHLIIKPWYKFEIMYDTSEGRYPYIIEHLGSAYETTPYGCLYEDSKAVIELKKYVEGCNGSVYVDWSEMNKGMAGYFCSVEIDPNEYTFEDAKTIAENIANIAERYARITD